MSQEILAISTIPENNQFTIPKEVRKHLELKPGDKIYWMMSQEREITIVRQLKF